MKRLDSLLFPWIQLLLLVVFSLTLISLLLGNYTYAGLLSHFKAHFALALGGIAAYTLFSRRWGWLGMAALGIVLNLSDMLYLYRAPDTSSFLQTTTELTSFRLLSANVLRSNQDYQAVIDRVQAENPDVIILIETTFAWQDGLRPLFNAYPYQILKPQDDYFGIMLLSRFPVVDQEVLYLCDPEVPTLHATIEIEGQRVSVVGTHPPAPPIYNEIHWRNQQLRGLADLATHRTHPMVITGDLNLTSYHPEFKRLLRNGNLKDSRRGFGIQPSWPVKLGPLGITLDHALVSESIFVRDRQILPSVGSDHAPLRLDLEIAPLISN